MNVFLLLYFILLAPKFLYDRLKKGKRHPAFLQRLGFKLVNPDRPVIWIHAVSVGEVKAAQALFKAIHSKEFFFFITTTTATGQAEAMRSLKGADAFGYLPIDFSWVAKKFVKRLNPKHFILVESDFWPNLLQALRKNGTKVSLVSGKISARSAKRFSLFNRFAKRLFAHFDHVCVQNEEYYHRFLPFVDQHRLHITGNLKLDLKAQEVDKTFEFKQPVITISCTHAPEENWILDALAGGDWTILLAPRHPERFAEVEALLRKKEIAFTKWSQDKKGRVVLIDAMGQLPICYYHSRLAILGGSFVNGIGGHNVLEPFLYGPPVFFGPYMQAQTELVKRVLEFGGGEQMPIEELKHGVVRFFSDFSREENMRNGAVRAIESGRGATEKTLKIIKRHSMFKKNHTASLEE